MYDLLKNYFSTTWLTGDRTLDQYTYSGWALIDKVQEDELVLDVGCGTNPFKGKIKNLVGIDITNVGSDIQVAIEDYYPGMLYDVAFCLGSLNFGSRENVYNQIKKVDSLLKDDGRIYWRCNPGRRDHNNSQCADVPFFDWNVELHEEWSKEFGYTLQNLQPNDHNRIYAEWVKLA
jgi:hypothetical protein